MAGPISAQVEVGTRKSGNSSVGRASASQATDFERLRAAYIEHRQAQGCCLRSFHHLTSTWKVLDQVSVADITTDDVLHWTNKFSKERKWSPQTKLHSINSLSSFFGWCIKRRYVTENPCVFVPRPKVRNERRFVISKEQLATMMKLLPLHIRDLVEVAAKTGLRFSNLANLEPRDLQQDEQDDYFLEMETKNGDLHRTYLYGTTLEIVRRRVAKNSDWLFSGSRGGQLTPKTVRRHLVPAAKAAGLKWGRSRYGFTFHSLRRAFASHLLNSGESIEAVMAAGGWRSYEAVRRYAYLSDKRKKDSFRRMDGIL